jgi:hypothetical protein
VTDETLVDWDTTPRLRDDVVHLLAQFPSSTTFLESFAERFDELCEQKNAACPSKIICRAFIKVATGLYEAEHFNAIPAPFSLALIGTMEGARYRDELLTLHRKAAHPKLTLDALHWTLTNSFLGLIGNLPALAFGEENSGTTTLSLLDTIDVGQTIFDITAPFLHDGAKHFVIFAGLREQLLKNQLEASNQNPKKLISPQDFDGSPREKVRAYLKNTPLESIFEVSVPFSIPEETRFSGHWIIAPPGRGKTTLLHSMFLDDLPRKASIIVMDSKGDLINPIKSMAAIADRLVLIEPDSRHPLALNPLDVPSENVPHTIALIEYILSGLLDAKFTNLQSALFRHVLPAMLQAFPHPTIETLKRVLADGLTKEEIAQLDDRLRQFFENKNSGFQSKTYAETRTQIIWRLDFILTNDAMRAMFASPTTRLQVGEAMNSGKVILIDASKARLGDDGSEFYQRFFLALILGAAQARSTLKPSEKLPVYCYLDECQWVRNDQKLATILDECRSQKIALILAHQRTDQITNPNVLSAMANCAIRFANSDDEAKYLAPKLRCEPEFLHNLPRGTFAAFVRDLTPHAIALKVPYRKIEDLPRMSADQQAAIRQRMRDDYGFIPAPPSIHSAVSSHSAREAPANATASTAKAGHDKPGSIGVRRDEPPAPSDKPETGSTW